MANLREAINKMSDKALLALVEDARAHIVDLVAILAEEDMPAAVEDMSAADLKERLTLYSELVNLGVDDPPRKS